MLCLTVSSTSLTALSPALWFSFLCKILSNTEVAVVKQGISDANTVLHNSFFFFPPTTFMYLFNLYLFSGNFRWRCSAALTSEYLYSFYQHETLLNMESCDHPGWNCEILCWISGVTSGFCFDVVFNSLLFQHYLLRLTVLHSSDFLNTVQITSLKEVLWSLILQHCWSWVEKN